MFLCGTRLEGVLEVLWLLRVQFLIVLKDELAARVTLHAVVCPDRLGYYKGGEHAEWREEDTGLKQE